jgi:uncharacterized protein YqeY
MALATSISEEIKSAMKAQDKDRLAALRDIKSKLLIEATKEGATGEPDDAAVLVVLTRLLKQRMESAELYAASGRTDLEQEERKQAEVIASFLPQQLSPDELQEAVSAIIRELGASSMADMGRVMATASTRLAGAADGKAISGVVRTLLSTASPS